jgi:hypothetical protein
MLGLGLALGLSALVTGDDSGGGGEGAPDWVPANAKIFIDLVNVRAWTEADGIVSIDTLLGSDPNTENAWGATSYSAGDLTADGLVYSSTPPALISAARTKILDAATIAVKFKQLTVNVNASLAVVAANGNDALESDLSNDHFQEESWNGPLTGAGHHIADIANIGVGVLNAFAVTITASRLEGAANGSSVITGTLVDADRPSGNPLVAVLMDSGNGYAAAALQSITIYDALPDTTGLSALSETG